MINKANTTSLIWFHQDDLYPWSKMQKSTKPTRGIQKWITQQTHKIYPKTKASLKYMKGPKDPNAWLI